MAEAVARELVVPLREVIEMSSRLTGDVSLNAPVSDDGPTEWEAMLVDHSPERRRRSSPNRMKARNRRERSIRPLMC